MARSHALDYVAKEIAWDDMKFERNFHGFMCQRFSNLNNISAFVENLIIFVRMESKIG